jgi:hypothetical protein
MAGRDNAFDMQIKLLMIGDSGNSYLTLLNFKIYSQELVNQVWEKPVFF